jgi:hypothetical protein
MKGQKITNKELRNIGIIHPDALIDIGKLAKKILKSRAIEKSGLLKFIHNVFTDSSYGNFESKELLELFELINSQR